jgi:hypothetical protein
MANNFHVEKIKQLKEMVDSLTKQLECQTQRNQELLDTIAQLTAGTSMAQKVNTATQYSNNEPSSDVSLLNFSIKN